MQSSAEALEPLLYTVNDTKRLLSISHTTTYKLINSGQLATRKIGGRTLITASSLRRLIEGEEA